MRERVRYLATLLAVAVVVASCTGSEAESSATSIAPISTSASGRSGTAPATLKEVLGSDQAVQDFVVFVGMWKKSDSPISTSFYEESLTHARAGSGEPMDIGGGFAIAPVTSINGSVIDSEGEPVPGLRLDFALLDIPAGELASAWAVLRDTMEEAGLSVPDPVAESTSLVEIVSADYAAARTHAGLGDVSQIDVSFLSAVQPGDDLAVAYFFGQTLPGDPSVEIGMQPSELFAYRWREGLVSFMGGETGPAIYVDDSVRAVEGSTLLQHDVKQAILDIDILVNVASAQGDAEKLFDDIEAELEQHEEAGDEEVVYVEIPPEIASEDTGGVFVAYVPPGEEEFVFTVPGKEVVLYPDDVAAALALARAARSCAEKKTALLERNEAAASVAPGSSNAVASTTTSSVPTTEGNQTTSTSEDSPPGPLSCNPPTPSLGLLPKPKSGLAYGDVHIATVDGNTYENQAAGEFLLFENEVATIQMRTEPWSDSETVSIATAFALRIGDQEVSLHAGGEMWIDGEAVGLVRGQPTPLGDGEILWWHGGWVVVWPDGTVLRVDEREVALVAKVTPSQGPAIGLLGDNDGNPDNDLFRRDGEVLAMDAEEDFESFYSTYVDSWRLTDDESLFHYDAEESTSTFVIEGFPAERLTADDLPDGLFAEAELICKELGVTAEEVVENCILDVAMTGDPMFAYDAYLAQEAITRSGEDEAGDSEDPTVSADGSSLLSVGDVTIAFGADPPIQDPSGPAPKWTCESADGVYTANNVFSESPTIRYELDLQYIGPDNSRGFDEQFRLTLLRNSEPYAWVWTNAEQFADSVEGVSVDGGVLTASGEMFLNDPLQPGLQPISPLPPGTELDSFELSVSCEG